MADFLARRGFLRGLATLPLLGGGVTLLGNPTAAAVPVTEELLWSYASWLEMEKRFAYWELGEQNSERYNRLVGIVRCDNPGGKFHLPDTPPPSTRAAVVLSAVGCGWRERAFTGR